MLCKKCGGKLSYANGQYICESCGNQYAVTDIYENIDAYICYIETDSAGRRTKDSILAQDIYQTLERSKINAFYGRISADGLTGEDAEKVCTAAMGSAKVILLFATQKAHFNMLAEKYATVYAGKIIVPVFTDMNAYEIPRGISAIQALDYGKVGASADLVKGLYNVLSREQPSDYTAISNRAQKRKKAALLIGISALLAVAIVTLLVWSILKNSGLLGSFSAADSNDPITSSETEESLYAEAMNCMESGNYTDAIGHFRVLSGYKDSDKQLNLIYQKYAGYYHNQNEGLSVHLQIWEDNAGAIEISKVYSNGIHCVISESIQLQGITQTVSFNDSENNQGNVILELTNNGIKIGVNTTSINSDFSLGNLNSAFLLSEKSDKLLAQIDAETILSWVTNRTTLSQLHQSGVELDAAESFDGMPFYKYQVKNTNIVLVLATIDFIAGDNADNLLLVALSAPARIVLPSKIGSSAIAFEENNVIFVPGGEVGGDVGTGLFFGFPEEITLTEISADTNICVTSPTAFGPDYEFLRKLYVRSN